MGIAVSDIGNIGLHISQFIVILKLIASFSRGIGQIIHATGFKDTVL